VAGTIAANTNNSVGVSGVTWQTRILPVRVLGKCGYNNVSDVADGIRWAAGLSVSGVPANPNPAKIINLSLGGQYNCTASEQYAITTTINAGATVIVAAGNDNINANNQSPANCLGVLVVAATDESGDRSIWNLSQNGASNFGSIVDIAAPGTNILSTLNAGSTSPTSNNYVSYNGTSMATPHVVGVAALLLSLRPGLTSTQIMDIISATVTRFPSGSTCTTSICGPGILNAAKVITNVIYVDKTYAGAKEYGLPNVPYKTIGKANTWTWDRARTMIIEHGTYLFSNTLNITKTLTLIAISGTVTIGQ